MCEFTKTVKDDKGANVTLSRSTDDPAEVTTMLSSGWEEKTSSMPPAIKPSAAPPAPKPDTSRN